MDLTRELVQADEVHLALTATQGSEPPAAWRGPLTAALPAREEVGLLYKDGVIGTLSVGRESAAQRFTREDR